MTALLGLAARSAWNRRFVLSLVVASIALSTLLLLGIERIRHDVRQNFAQAVSGTDLIVGARTGSVQLLLYAVFRIGNATNNISWRSAQAVAQMPGVAWTVPISLGDSHRGFAVVGTTGGYFQHFLYGERQPLQITQGRAFADDTSGVFEAVLGADVARRLGYTMGQRVVLSHGDGTFAANDHADKPFTVVGILAPTGTPVDRSLHISLAGMQALHIDWLAGVPLPGMKLTPGQALQRDLTPRAVTALLVGLQQRSAVFSVQRRIADTRDEPLMAVLPGVALDELWDLIGAGEKALLLMSGLVAVVSVAGLVAVILAGLDQRRRELAILRAVGAGPRTVAALLALEGGLVTAAGLLLGTATIALVLALAGPAVLAQFGVVLQPLQLGATEWQWLALLGAGGLLASAVPGWRAYRIALADGLQARV
ncbi:MAG: ABC transporter permease [Rubrivivax sp.]|nr:ABC transporter permease [Rubrivivax sp.]